MLLQDLTWKEHLAVSYEDGVEDGMEKGVKKGVVIGMEKGVVIGREEIFSLWESGMSLTAVKRKLGYKSTGRKGGA
jgi:hypothetical protein